MTSYGLDEWSWAMFEPTWTYLISILVNFLCELGQIMTRCDFLWVRWLILSNPSPHRSGPLPRSGYRSYTTSPLKQCSNRLELDLISLLVNFLCELGQIMTRCDFLWVRWLILSNPSPHRSGPLPRSGYRSYTTSPLKQCSNRLELDLISLLVNFLCELGQIMTR